MEQTEKHIEWVQPELITEFRPDEETTCPICGERYSVIQINREPDYVRIGCWNHGYSDKILRIEQIRSIDGKPATDFNEYPFPSCVTDIKNINGYNWP